MIDSEPGTSSAPAAPWSEPEDDQPFERRREAAQGRRDGEADQADGVDPPPAVVVGQGAGQDEQRGEDREVAADDVGLALEDADERRRQLLPDARQRDVHDRAVEEDGAGPDDRRDERPALAGVIAGVRSVIGAVSQVDSRAHARTRGARRRR